MGKHEPKRRKLRVSEETASLIRGLHPAIKRKIKSALKMILSDHGTGKSLKGDLQGLRSYRVGRFRILYRVSSRDVIEVVAIGPRHRIYEGTYRLLKKEK